MAILQYVLGAIIGMFFLLLLFLLFTGMVAVLKTMLVEAIGFWSRVYGDLTEAWNKYKTPEQRKDYYAKKAAQREEDANYVERG